MGKMTLQGGGGGGAGVWPIREWETLQGIVEAAGTMLTGDSGRQANQPIVSEGAGGPGHSLMRRKVYGSLLL